MIATKNRVNERDYFNWEISNKFIVNKKVKSKTGDKVYCHEDYASSLYSLINGTDPEVVLGKDLKEGEMYECVLNTIRENDALAHTTSGQTIYIDLKKERKDSERLNIPGISFLPGESIKVIVRNMNGTFYGSVIECHIQSLKAEFFNQIKKETLAYEAKVESVNKGGYLVDVQGIKCFLPGSLAAANKISDFDSLIGKTFFVMIDGYVQNKDIFVVSYKKYLSRIMETKIQELDLTKKYKGYVTGTSNFGIFVEWEDVYTGLIHKTEFENQIVNGFNPGDEIEFYIKEVKDDNRLTLTFGEPVKKTMKIYEFKKQIEEGTSEVITACIKHKRKNGALIELIGDQLMALIPQEKLDNKSKNLKVGDNLDVRIYQVDPVQGKIFAEPVND